MASSDWISEPAHPKRTNLKDITLGTAAHLQPTFERPVGTPGETGEWLVRHYAVTGLRDLKTAMVQGHGLLPYPEDIYNSTSKRHAYDCDWAIRLLVRGGDRFGHREIQRLVKVRRRELFGSYLPLWTPGPSRKVLYRAMREQAEKEALLLDAWRESSHIPQLPHEVATS